MSEITLNVYTEVATEKLSEKLWQNQKERIEQFSLNF